jgi:hypothetical protein
MATELDERVRDVLVANKRALSSSEIAARLRRPRQEIEETLAALAPTSELVVREFTVADPHFGMERVVVATAVDAKDADTGGQAADARCQRVFDELLRDFLASHRCV